MFTKFKVPNNGKTAVAALADTPGLDPAKVTATVAQGRVVILTDDSGLDSTSQVDLSQVSAQLQKLMMSVDNNFIGRSEMIQAIMTALVAGEHVCILGPPGTAKTSIGKQLVVGINGKVFTILMNPDITREALLGMTDVVALQNNQWTRKWAGLATCDLGIVDEIWKSSGQNANILLDLAEERIASEGDTKINVPLISLIGMSNEVPEDDERQAIYDRFLVRLQVSYLNDSSQFASMLTAPASTAKPVNGVCTDHLRLMSGVAEYMALNPPKSMLDTITKLWKEIGLNGRSVSDRRWRKTLKLAMASALLNNEAPASNHLNVCRWTLWNDPDEAAEVEKLVMSHCDPFTGVILNYEALLNDLNTRLGGIADDDLQGKAEISGQAGKLRKQADSIKDEAGLSNSQVAKLDSVMAGCQDVIDQIISSY